MPDRPHDDSPGDAPILPRPNPLAAIDGLLDPERFHPDGTPREDAEAAAKPRRRGNGGASKHAASPQLIVERRVTAVFSAVVAGLQTWEIQRAVAEMQEKEQRARAKAREMAKAQGKEHPDVEALLTVPLVWGDDPIPKRTFEGYLTKARRLLDAQAGQFAAQRSRILATQAARLDSVYAKAINGGKLYAALKAAELTIDLFGLRDHARSLTLVAGPAGDPDAAESGDSPDGRAIPSTPEARARAFGELLLLAGVDPARGSIMP